MNVGIRPLKSDDFHMVGRIEREAFPTLWPPTSLKREMENRRVKYLVAWEPREDISGLLDYTPRLPDEDGRGSGSGLTRLIDIVRGRLTTRREPEVLDYHVLGFVGMWFMADEAHITAIAVEEASRGKGIGELLLIGSIDLALYLGSAVVSLEARVSNHVARSLYNKYEFEDMGIRKAYYTDNREDAVIMTTRPIHSLEYQARYRDLRRTFEQRYGEPSIVLA